MTSWSEAEIPMYRDGVYFYKITAGYFMDTKKMTLIK
jgi:hypothetical protein